MTRNFIVYAVYLLTLGFNNELKAIYIKLIIGVEVEENLNGSPADIGFVCVGCGKIYRSLARTMQTREILH